MHGFWFLPTVVTVIVMWRTLYVIRTYRRDITMDFANFFGGATVSLLSWVMYLLCVACSGGWL